VLLVVAFVISSDARPAAAPPRLSGRNAIVIAVSLPRLSIAREADGARVGDIDVRSGVFAISPDATRVAYLVGPDAEIWIADVPHIDRAQRLLSVAPLVATGLVWSTDGKGILFSTRTREQVPGPEGEPLQVTLEGIHLDPNRRELFWEQPQVSVHPLLWVREPKTVTAVFGAGQKGPSQYLAVSAGGARSWAITDATRPEVSVGSFLPSSNGRWAAALYHYGSRALIRVWPAEDFASAVELESPGADVRSMVWRPGGLEIAVDAGGVLELWTRDGTRRRVADLGGRFLSAFRWDGSAIYAGSLTGQAELIEVDTGRHVQLPGIISTISSGPFGTGIVASARLE
jgi:hypothetical protein